VAGQAQSDPAGVSDARRALLERLIDHAALFPPASLPMDAALEEDRRARASAEAWMLDRFICPASKLGELPAAPPALSVVGDGEPGADPAGLPVELVEARVGDDEPAAVHERVRAVYGDGPRVFLELPIDDRLERNVDAVRGLGAGAKVRCGGETTPSADELAAFVTACVLAGVPFKATAGLHHPVRGMRPGMHGFLNLLAAATFAGAANLVRILEEEDPAAFSVTAEAFSVHGRRAGAGLIARVRRDRLTAYGSCSFFEPVEDLTALGILPV
jgi:hypothetical protein